MASRSRRLLLAIVNDSKGSSVGLASTEYSRYGYPRCLRRVRIGGQINRSSPQQNHNLFARTIVLRTRQIFHNDVQPLS